MSSTRHTPMPGHHEIEEYEHAGAHFGHAVEIGRESGCRGRAHADDRAGETRRPQSLRRAYDGRTLLLGHRADVVGAPAVVGSAGMRHHAAEPRAALASKLPISMQLSRVGFHAGAMAVAVDLDQYVEPLAARA